MPTDDSSPRISRRHVLGYATAGLTGTSVTALARDGPREAQSDPDGNVITFPDCRTAVVEGDQWEMIRAFEVRGSDDDTTRDTRPDGDGVTRLSVSDGVEGYIDRVQCFTEVREEYFVAFERENPDADRCTDSLRSSADRHVVIFGGGGGDRREYRFTAAGEITPSDSARGAPIEDEHVSFNTAGEYRDSISDDGRTARGWVAGGGDAYDFTGEILESEWGDCRVYVDGDRRN